MTATRVPPEGTRRSARPTRDRLVLVVAVALPLVVLAVGAWQYRWMSDDGFINLRVVANITSGHGPVFNAGERVEATTSPLWLWTLWLGDVVLPVRLEWIAVLGGIALTLAGVLAACIGAVRLYRPRPPALDRWWMPAGALVLVAIAPSWKFSSSGLENGLTVAWIGTSLLLLARWARTDARVGLPTAAVLGLGPLVRPELGLLAVATLGLVIVADGPGLRHRLAVLAVGAAAPVAYELFRMGYYAALVPNSAIAKEAGRAHWSSGWEYLRAATLPYELWLPLLLLAAVIVPLAATRGTPPRVRALLVLFPVVGVLDALYVIRVGGDFMQARLLLPALLMICAPVAIVPVRRTTLAALAIVPWAVVAVVGLRSGDDAPSAFGPPTRNAVTLEDFGWGPDGPARSFFDGEGVYFLRTRLPGTPSAHDPAVSAYGVGVESYALGPDTYVLDLLGLGDAFTAHLRLGRRGVVAHEKPLPFPWIPARLLRPGAPVGPGDFQVPPLFLARPLGRPGGEPFAARVRDARITLRCKELRDFTDRYTAPLTVGRFLGNVLAAPAATTFRIEPEPSAARRQLCG